MRRFGRFNWNATWHKLKSFSCCRSSETDLLTRSNHVYTSCLEAYTRLINYCRSIREPLVHCSFSSSAPRLGPLQALYESAFGTVAVDESAVTVAVTSTHPDLFTNAVPNHLVQQWLYCHPPTLYDMVCSKNTNSRNLCLPWFDMIFVESYKLNVQHY